LAPDADAISPDPAAPLASYSAGPQVEAYLEPLAIGDNLPDMPLFLHPDRYVNTPLETTYQAAFRGLPGYWKDVLDGKAT
jgi:hypothetical protein